MKHEYKEETRELLNEPLRTYRYRISNIKRKNVPDEWNFVTGRYHQFKYKITGKHYVDGEYLNDYIQYL